MTSFLPSRIRSRIALAWLTAIPLGCGASTGLNAPSDDAGTIPVAPACAARASATCARLSACSNGGDTAQSYGDLATCVAQRAAACMSELGAPISAATPATISACANAIPQESCDDFLGENPPAACLPPTGPLPAGESCVVDAQCQSTFCKVPEGSGCGACAPLPTSGAACVGTHDCGARDHLTCSTSRTCVAYGETTEMCNLANPCGPGLWCVGADLNKGGVGSCQPALSTAGSACDVSNLTGPGCDGFLFLMCSSATATCQPVPVVAAGQTCGEKNGVLQLCAANGVCSGDAEEPTGPAGTCEAASVLGSPCDYINGPSCFGLAKCVARAGETAGTCELPSATGCN